MDLPSHALKWPGCHCFPGWPVSGTDGMVREATRCPVAAESCCSTWRCAGRDMGACPVGPTLAPGSGNWLPQGWSCMSFQVCVSLNKVKCNHIISLDASNFHSESDFFLIKENNQREVPNHTISALTLPSNGNFRRTMPLPNICTV